MKKYLELINKIPDSYFKDKNSDNYCFYNPPNLAAVDIGDLPNDLNNIVDEYKKLDKMSIYVNIPFCGSCCVYCNYFLHLYDDKSNDFLNNTLKEFDILDQNINLSDKKIKSIYFGGGTPSSITFDYLDVFLSKINDVLNKDEKCEITFECCPEEGVIEKLGLLKEKGVTRLSFGVQSLNDEVLKKLNRRHNSEMVKKVVGSAKKLFDNINIDMIYGLPEQNVSDWIETIKSTIELGTSGITIYKLSTFGFGKSYRNNGSPMFHNHKGIPDEKTTAAMYFEARETLLEEGFIEPLIGFFVKPKINDIKVYKERWSKALPIYGLGLGAFSYGPFGYLGNADNKEKYLTSIENNELPVKTIKVFDEKENLLFRFLGRLKVGGVFTKEEIPVELLGFLQEMINPFLLLGFIKIDNNNLSLTYLGRAFVDRIAFEILDLSKTSKYD